MLIAHFIQLNHKYTSVNKSFLVICISRGGLERDLKRATKIIQIIFNLIGLGS